MSQGKFQFDVDFQQEILQFTVTDIQLGFKALELFDPEYFTLIEHALIAEALKRFYEKKFTVPSKAVLKEELRNMLRTQKWQKLLLDGDKEKTLKIVNKIYSRPVKNAESIYEACKRFAQYSALTSVLEGVNLEDFASYERLTPSIQKAITKGNNLAEDKGMFLLADAKARITRRADSPPGFPTPFWQLNQMFNNGGTSYGNVITIMGEEKKFKTGVLLNLARGYLKMGKVFLIADFENGEQSLSTRADQSILGTDRKTLLSGIKTDSRLLKRLRQYKRFGGELVIKRFPAGSTALTVQAYIKMLKEEYNITVNAGAIDYPDVMGDTMGSKAEHERISHVYLDLKNVGEAEKIEALYCPSHITREASKDSGKKRKTSDASKSQDKSRHADMTLSLEQTDEEREAGVMRLELVNQRDGPQEGRVYFWADIEKQRLKEMTRTEVKGMEEIRKEAEEKKKLEKAERDGDNAILRKQKRKDVSDI